MIRVGAVDIGGGSTEFVLGLGSDILHKESLEIGRVKITEKFMGESLSQPASSRTIKNMEDHTDELLHHTVENILNISRDFEVVAIGGTATTLFAVKNGVEGMQGGALEQSELKDFIHRLSIRDKNLVEKISCIESGRDDIILSGVMSSCV